VTTSDIQFEAITEDALLLRFGERIELAVNARVHAAVAALQRALPQLECVPAYASLLLRFDPLAWHDADAVDPQRRLCCAVDAALAAGGADMAIGREQIVPVCYGGAFGPDLDEVASHCGLTAEAVIARHAAAEYRVAMVGFAPGFPYLLGLDPVLAMPRRADPRQRVPAGSVAIGGHQTGIYPEQLPGGWQLIGRTPLRLFDVNATRPSLLAAGDRVRFRAIGEAEFRQLDTERQA
jgi:KipI family sensor histidine kinase inhibitor